jgi:uncharacterized membrane protein HdeD (DUF308 family)
LFQTLTKNWLLLALCGVLEAIISIAYLMMQHSDGPLTFHAWNATVVFLGKVAMAAGVCAIVAGVWRSTDGKSWLLVLNGLALGALGLIQYGFTRFPISFLVIALLVILMAISASMLEFETARILRRRRHFADGWFLGSAGVISVAFALAFLALGLRWIKLEPGSHSDLLWLGLFFGFSAICMLGMSVRLHGGGVSVARTVPLPAE